LTDDLYIIFNSADLRDLGLSATRCLTLDGVVINFIDAGPEAERGKALLMKKDEFDAYLARIKEAVTR